jgi:hypothetical protein
LSGACLNLTLIGVGSYVFVLGFFFFVNDFRNEPVMFFVDSIFFMSE